MKRRVLFGSVFASAFLIGLPIYNVDHSPLDTRGLESHPAPVLAFEEATGRIDQLQRAEGSDISEPCRTRFYSHGRRTGRVIVLLHGLTNCPQQYAQFAPAFFNQGDNVFVPRMPYNGLADVNTSEHSRLTAGEMRRYADEVVDIAAGLGDRMIVVGFSAGGVLSAWIGQNRAEPDLVVTVSPALGITSSPPRVSRFLARMFPALPDFRIPIKASGDPPVHAYTAYSSHGLGEMLRLSEAVFQQAESTPPKSKRLLAVVNPTDPAVSESTFRYLIALWTRKAPAKVTVRTFRAELGLSHDIIDPAQPKQRVNVVYPALTHWIRTLCCADQ